MCIRDRYKKALPFFLIGLIFIPVVKVTICYLYATDKVKLSYLLIYLEPITVALFAGIILPAFWGLQGVWMAIPVTQFLLSVMSTGFLILERLKR